jgi:hypothetical protein
MIEIEIVVFKNGICVQIIKMEIDKWKNLKKEKGFIYKAYQIGFHSFVIGK